MSGQTGSGATKPSVTLSPDDIEVKPDGSLTVKQHKVQELKDVAESAKAQGQGNLRSSSPTNQIRVDI